MSGKLSVKEVLFLALNFPYFYIEENLKLNNNFLNPVFNRKCMIN